MLYLLGGIGRSQGSECLTGVDAYNPGAASWQTGCMQLPIACAWGAAAALGQAIYVMGGSSDRGDPASQNCMVYMPDRPTPDTGDCWYQVSLTLAALPACEPASGLAIETLFRGSIAQLNVLPACRLSCSCCPTAFMFVEALRVEQVLCAMQCLQKRLLHAMCLKQLAHCTCQSKLLQGCGLRSASPVFVQFPAMESTRGGLSTAVLNDHIYALGGTARKSHLEPGVILDTVEFADTARAQWIPVSPAPGFPACSTSPTSSSSTLSTA